jgi:ADP-heptose:LPS heptosyltransferase/predicted SAM-dependent methyltransferase
MTWHPETSRGQESQKIAPWAVRYLDGRGFDIGCGDQKVVPWATGMDRHKAADINSDGRSLPEVASASVDFVFSSHFIEHCEDYESVLAEWWRVIKVGGHLVLYWPHPDHYPRIGQFGANSDHKHDITPHQMFTAMLRAASRAGHGWDQVEDETRSGGNEYSQFAVFRKRADLRSEGGRFVRNPDGLRRAVVIRFGAIGDIISATSVLPGLQEKGYHVTFACSSMAQEWIKHEDGIDEFLTFPTMDSVHMIAPMLAERFDRVVNLTHTFEGMVLTLPGSPASQWPASARRKVLAIDYLTLMATIAEQVKIGTPRFVPTGEESWEAKNSNLTIAWALKGSGPQKWYPWTPQVLTRLLLKHPRLRVKLLAGPEVADLADKIVGRVREFGGPDCADRVQNLCGKLSIRQSLAAISFADMAVGVETGLMWAVARDRIPKVLICSHSDPRQFSTWINTTALHSRPECGPCIRLITEWDQCHRVAETGAALCAHQLIPEAVLEAIETGLEQINRQEKEQAA